MIIASKGAAGVTGAGLATLAGGLSAYRPTSSTASASSSASTGSCRRPVRSPTSPATRSLPPHRRLDQAVRRTAGCARCSRARSLRRDPAHRPRPLGHPGGGCQGAGLDRGRHRTRGRRHPGAQRLPRSGGSGGGSSEPLVSWRTPRRGRLRPPPPLRASTSRARGCCVRRSRATSRPRPTCSCSTSKTDCPRHARPRGAIESGVPPPRRPCGCASAPREPATARPTSPSVASSTVASPESCSRCARGRPTLRTSPPPCPRAPRSSRWSSRPRRCWRPRPSPRIPRPADWRSAPATSVATPACRPSASPCRGLVPSSSSPRRPRASRAPSTARAVRSTRRTMRRSTPSRWVSPARWRSRMPRSGGSRGFTPSSAEVDAARSLLSTTPDGPVDGSYAPTLARARALVARAEALAAL